MKTYKQLNTIQINLLPEAPVLVIKQIELFFCFIQSSDSKQIEKLINLIELMNVTSSVLNRGDDVID